jgi:flagellar hook-length control protein FliK
LQIKAEPKAEVKPDQPAVATVPDKREAPAPSALTPTAAALADTTAAAAATTTTGTHATVHGEVRAVHSAYQAPSPINLPHMAFEIVRQVQQGVSRFQIRLDPPELGRIDVKLDMDQSGQVNAKLIVERSETLDLLQRDQRALERALAQAGLDTSKTNLEFSLRQNPFAGQDGKGQGQPGASPFASDIRAPLVAEAEAQAAVTVYRGSASPGGVNMFV